MCATLIEATDFPLSDEIRKRYLNYSLSVITNRALPDVRDGLKPVQRRILYAMWHDLHLTPDARPMKSAKVVGVVIGNYHPHGDTAAYEAMVRMAQPWVMWIPLVDGHGNFGSPDGDGAAAFRYTEARLAPASSHLLGEINRDTVPFRETYDNESQEPCVLPAEYPNLLVNGASGIAVGMATSIPPHNMREVIKGVLSLLDRPDQTVTNLMRHIKGPDFPTGGEVLNSKVELRRIYELGKGSIQLRGTYRVEKGKYGMHSVIIDSVPYAVNKGTLFEKMVALVVGRKIPQIIDIRDESTNEVRIVLELKKGADAAVAMAYLYKHTHLQSNFNVDFNCLIPTGNGDQTRPQRLDLVQMCRQFLDFRVITVKRRFEFDLAKLLSRIHILEGFEKVFDGLDLAIKIIRRSKGKKDAAPKLMAEFDLDELQTDAILELKLYRLGRLEIGKILEELAEKRAAARKIRGILGSKAKLNAVIREELTALIKLLGRKRRTSIGKAEELPEFDAEAYVVAEDTYVVITRDGWVKRQGSIKTIKGIRKREKDEIRHILAGSTRECVVFFSSQGKAYVIRITDIPATTGHGVPIQKLFKFADGERLVGAVSLDPRYPLPEVSQPDPEEPPGPHMLAVTRGGFGLRFSLEGHREPSTRSGRKFARNAKEDEIIGVVPVTCDEALITASRSGHVQLCPVHEVNALSGAGKGVIVQKLEKNDLLIGFGLAEYEHQAVMIEKEGGSQLLRVSPRKYRLTSRAGKGFALIKRGKLSRVIDPEVTLPELRDNG